MRKFLDSITKELPDLIMHWGIETLDELRQQIGRAIFNITPDKQQRERKPTSAPPTDLLKDGTPIGEYRSSWRTRTVYLPISDRRHKIVQGATRMGKTEWALNYCLNLAKVGRGFAYLDNADGEAVDRLLKALPDTVLDRVVLLDFDKLHPIPANIYSSGNNDIFTQNRLTNSWVTFFIDNFGIDDQYMTQELIRYGCRLAFSVPGNTLEEVIGCIERPEIRHRLLEQCKERDVVEWWYSFETKYSEARQREIMASFMRRAGLIKSDINLRHIVCQRPKAPMEYRKWVDNDYIILVKAKETLGRLAVRTIMSIVVLSIWSAIMGRDDIPIHQRKSFMVIADEPHTWLSNNEQVLDDIFSKAAKYGLGMICLFQSTKQISKESRPLLSIILDNKPDIIMFRSDSEIKLTGFNIQNLPRYEFIASIDGYQPFLCKSPGQIATPYNRSLFTKEMQEHFGRPYRDVAAEIDRRYTTTCDANLRERTLELQQNGSIDTANPDCSKEILVSSDSSLRIG